MRVYRYLTSEELDNILQGKLDDVGGNYYGMENNFSYKRNCKYLHFFKGLSDIEYIRKLKKWRVERGDYEPVDFYVCEFDIPLVVLMLSAGKGVYNKTDENPKGTRAREFAVNAKNVKAKWLKSYIKDDLNRQFDATSVQTKLNEFKTTEDGFESI